MQAGGAGPRRSPTRSEPPRCAPSPCLRPRLGRFQPPGILSALLTPVSLGARGRGRRRRLTWSAYPRRFAADVFKKFRHGRKGFGSGRSPRAAEELSAGRTAAPKLLRAPKLKALSRRPGARRAPSSSAGTARGCRRPAPRSTRSRTRPGGTRGLRPPSAVPGTRVAADLPAPPNQPPRNGGGSALGPTLPLSFPSRARSAAAHEARRGPGDFTPASAPAPLADTARRQRSGVGLGKLSAEAGNNKRGARPRPPPPLPSARSPPGARLPPAAAEGPGPRGRRGPERRAPPGGRPAPPAAAARGVPAWREAHPGPLRGRGAGDRGAEGGEPAPGPAERRTETPRSAGNGGGRRTHRPGLPRCLLRPQNHNKALPKMAARPCPAGGRRGRGLRANGAGPRGGRDTPTWLRRRPRGAPPHPRRPPPRAGRRVRARPPPHQSAPSSRPLGRRGELLRVPEGPAPSRAAGRPGSRIPPRRLAPVRVRKLERIPKPGPARSGARSARAGRSRAVRRHDGRAPRAALLARAGPGIGCRARPRSSPCGGTRGAAHVPARTAEAEPRRSATRCAGSAASRTAGHPHRLLCDVGSRNGPQQNIPRWVNNYGARRGVTSQYNAVRTARLNTERGLRHELSCSRFGHPPARLLSQDPDKANMFHLVQRCCPRTPLQLQKLTVPRLLLHGKNKTRWSPPCLSLQRNVCLLSRPLSLSRVSVCAVKLQAFHTSFPLLKKKPPQEPLREPGLLRQSMKSLKDSPKPALYLSLAGLIPLVSMPLLMVLQKTYHPELAFVQVTYGAAIVAFIGGMRWGFAVPENSPAKPDWVNLANSTILPLLAWQALLFKDITSSAVMLVLSLGIALHYDLSLLPTYPLWFKGLRIVVTVVAVLSLLATLAMKMVSENEPINSRPERQNTKQ